MEKVHFKNLTNPLFKEAFIEYFQEFGFIITLDSKVFKDMESEEGNCLITYTENSNMVAFLMYRKDKLSNWFFSEDFIFIREFWVKSEYRNKGFGKSLLLEIEAIANETSIRKLILTTDSADGYYQKLGYINDHSYSANNHDRVYTKQI